MVIADVLRQKPLQVILVEYDHVIEEVFPATLNPPFRNLIGGEFLNHAAIGV